MIINKLKCKIAVTDILLFVCSVIYFFGIRYWFPVCRSSGDMIMSCHWAGKMLEALSVLFIVVSAAHFIIPDEKIKAGMDISSAGIAVLSLMIPGNIISLCKNSEMMCRNGTSVWTTVFMAVFIIFAAADVFIYLQSFSSEKHKRKGAVKDI